MNTVYGSVFPFQIMEPKYVTKRVHSSSEDVFVIAVRRGPLDVGWRNENDK